jgi:hypothetical protein
MAKLGTRNPADSHASEGAKPELRPQAPGRASNVARHDVAGGQGNEAAAFFDRAVRDIHRESEGLAGAIAGKDERAALGAVASLRQALGSAQAHLRHVPAHTRAEHRATLVVLRSRAEALLARAPEASAAAAPLADQIAGLGAGAPANAGIRGAVEGAVGGSLAGAQVHSSAAANELARAQGARAFTFGSSIVLGAGESPDDAELIAHELTHVAQQRGARPEVQRKGDVASPAERHADAVAGKVAAPGPGTGDPAAAHDLALALPLITTRWKQIGGDLFTPASVLVHVPPIASFQRLAYGLVADSQADVPPVLAALGGPGRAAYKQAFDAVLRDVANDAPHVTEIAAELGNLRAGGQVQHNATRIMAHQALLSSTGKRALASNRSAIEPFERYLAGPCRAQGELEATDQLGRIAQAGMSVPDPLAVSRAGATRLQACTSVLGIVRSGAAADAAAEQKLDDKDLVVDPALAAQAHRLTQDIDAVLARKPDGKPLAIPQLARIQAAVEAAGPKVRDFVWADKVTVGKLVRALDASQASALVDQLDPVERLYQTCKGAVSGDEDPAQVAVLTAAMRIPVPQQVHDDQRKRLVLKAGGGVFTALHDWLAAHHADQAMRTRVLTHTRLKDECIGRLAQGDQRVIYRMIARGSEAPTAEDTALDAAQDNRPADLVRGLRALAGTDRPRLAALEHVAVFRTAIEGMTAEVTVDGQQIRPYQLALALWGHTSGAVVDPTAQRQGEINPPGADDTPLTIAERITLNRELFDAALTELHDEITGKNVPEDQRRFLEMTRKLGNPQRVMDILVKYDRLAATRFLPLLRREHLVFGAELEARYTQKYQQALRTWIYEHSGPNNRSGSNRVLGTEQGAGVGMFNGKIMAAGEVAQPGRMTLQQALRENVAGGMPLSEIASVQARALARAVDDSNVSGVMISWTVFSSAVMACKAELEKETGIAIRPIDLIRNAYQEQAGHLETRLAEKFEPAALAQIRRMMGLVAGLDDVAGARPPSISERAERLFAQPAKLLWDSIGRLLPGSLAPDYVAVRVILETARSLPALTDVANQDAEPRVLAVAGGHDVEERPPRSFAGYYRLHYGTSPELHLRAQVRSFGDAERPVRAELAAALVFGTSGNANYDLFTRPVAGDQDQVEIGPHNRKLVRASFTAATATANAGDIWRILHTDGKLQLIETELYGPYNDEEQRLIRLAFRKLSGGLDLTFYIRQAIDARARLKANPADGSGPMGLSYGLLDPNSQKFKVGAGDAGGSISTRGSESELERGLAVSMAGELDVRTRVRNAVQRDEDGQVVRIVDELSPAERKQVLADGALVDAMQRQLSQQNYERVFKVLTGQADLSDRMLSRTVGDSWWKKHVSGASDEKGMEEDLRRYVDNLSLRFDRELRGKLAAQGQSPEAIDDAIRTRTREACADMMTDANVKDIIDRHLGTTDAAKARSILLNGGAEHDYLVAAHASAAEILDEIRSLSAKEREAKLADPAYLRMLGAQLTDQKDYRDAMNALTAGGDKVGSGSGGLAHLDEKSRTDKQTWGSSTDARETLRALAALSPAEYDRLRGDPQLQLQLLNALETEDEKALARELLYPGAAAATPGVDDARAFVTRQCAYRLRVACKTSNKWSVVLEEAIAVYKAALDDAPAAADPGHPAAAPAAGQASAARRAVWDQVAADVARFARDHDDHPGALTTDRISGAQMIDLVHKAVLHQADPSDALISAKIWTTDEQLAASKAKGEDTSDPFVRARASDDRYEEADLIAALNSASDEHVASQWTSIAATPAGGGTTMKQMYARYRTAFDAAAPSLLRREAPAPPPASHHAGAAPAGGELHAPAPPAAHEVRALGDADPAIAEADLRRQQFLQFVVQVSASLEAMLRPHMGDHRELTAASDPAHAKLSGTGNKRYDNLTEVVLARVPRLAPEAIAKAVQMAPGDVWLLSEGTRQQVGMFNLRHEKNLRSRGEQTSERWAGSEEKEELDTSRVRYGRAMAVALTDGSIDASEAANLDKLGDENDRARDAYKTALDTAAMWASLVVGTLVTIAATILTGGLALGPVAAMAIGGATAALSAAAKSLVNKSILDAEWDSRDTHELIAKEVITSLVTIGTTFYAQKLLAAVGSVGTVAKQANAARGVLAQQPPIWRVFLNQASEQVTSTAMSSVVEAGLEATDPRHWIDGYREGEVEAKAAGMARLAQVPGDIKNGVITSLLTAGIGHVLSRGGGHVEFGAAAAQRRSVSLSRNIKKVFGDPEQKVTGALVEWAMNQHDPIDWGAAPAELLQGTIRQYNQVGTEMHSTTANTATRARAGHDSLAISRHELTGAEQTAYTAMNAHAGATDPFVSAKDYGAMRQQVAATGLGAWEAHNPGHELSPAQREAFVKWVREAPDADTLASRANTDPRTTEAVVNAGKAPAASHDRAAGPRPAQDKISRGPSLAARIPGATYQGEGRFRVTTAHGGFEVRIARVAGTAARLRAHPDGDGMLLEIPLGLGDAEFDHAIIEQLAALHDHQAPGAAHDRPVPVSERPTQREMPAVDPVAALRGHTPDDAHGATARPARRRGAQDEALEAGARPHATAHEAAAPAAAHAPRHVDTDFRDLKYMTHMPPAVIAGHQVERAGAHLKALPEGDYHIFQSLHAGLPSSTAQAFLYKALAAGNSMGDIQWMAGYMVGKSDAWLVGHLTLGDFHGQGTGVQQQWSMSCNASTAITMRGNYDPVFAFKVRQHNTNISAVDVNDPMTVNANLAGMEKGLLESTYKGEGFPAYQGGRGQAVPHSAGASAGRFGDDLLNMQTEHTGLRFTTKPNPTPHEALSVLDSALSQGLQVPVIIGAGPKDFKHYVLCQARQVNPVTGQVEFQFHNTGDGSSSWVTAHQIVTGSMGISGYNMITVLEVPSAVSNAVVAPTAKTQVMAAVTPEATATAEVAAAAPTAKTQVMAAVTAAPTAKTQVMSAVGPDAATAAPTAKTQVMSAVGPDAATAAPTAKTQVMSAVRPEAAPAAPTAKTQVMSAVGPDAATAKTQVMSAVGPDAATAAPTAKTQVMSAVGPEAAPAAATSASSTAAPVSAAHAQSPAPDPATAKPAAPISEEQRFREREARSQQKAKNDPYYERAMARRNGTYVEPAIAPAPAADRGSPAAASEPTVAAAAVAAPISEEQRFREREARSQQKAKNDPYYERAMARRNGTYVEPAIAPAPAADHGSPAASSEPIAAPAASPTPAVAPESAPSAAAHRASEPAVAPAVPASVTPDTVAPAGPTDAAAKARALARARKPGDPISAEEQYWDHIAEREKAKSLPYYERAMARRNGTYVEPPVAASAPATDHASPAASSEPTVAAAAVAAPAPAVAAEPAPVAHRATEPTAAAAAVAAPAPAVAAEPAPVAHRATEPTAAVASASSSDSASAVAPPAVAAPAAPVDAAARSAALARARKPGDPISAEEHYWDHIAQREKAANSQPFYERAMARRNGTYVEPVAASSATSPAADQASPVASSEPIVAAASRPTAAASTEPTAAASTVAASTAAVASEPAPSAVAHRASEPAVAPAPVAASVTPDVAAPAGPVDAAAKARALARARKPGDPISAEEQYWDHVAEREKAKSLPYYERAMARRNGASTESPVAASSEPAPVAASSEPAPVASEGAPGGVSGGPKDAAAKAAALARARKPGDPISAEEQYWDHVAQSEKAKSQPFYERAMARRNGTYVEPAIAAPSTPSPAADHASPVAASEPVAARPSEPVAARPSEPVAAPASEPIAARPSEPVAAPASQPSATASVEPAVAAPPVARPTSTVADPAPVVAAAAPTVAAPAGPADAAAKARALARARKPGDPISAEEHYWDHIAQSEKAKSQPFYERAMARRNGTYVEPAIAAPSTPSSAADHASPVASSEPVAAPASEPVAARPGESVAAPASQPTATTSVESTVAAAPVAASTPAVASEPASSAVAHRASEPAPVAASVAPDVAASAGPVDAAARARALARARKPGDPISAEEQYWDRLAEREKAKSLPYYERAMARRNGTSTEPATAVPASATAAHVTEAPAAAHVTEAPAAAHVTEAPAAAHVTEAPAAAHVTEAPAAAHVTEAPAAAHVTETPAAAHVTEAPAAAHVAEAPAAAHVTEAPAAAHVTEAPAATHVTETPAAAHVTEAPAAAHVTEAPAAAHVTEAPAAAHVAEAAPAPAISTAKEGLESLNTAGAFDYRMQRVERLRQDILTGSMNEISPDVSPEVAELMHEHIGNLDNEQLAAIQGYTSEDYKAINRVMRNPEGDPAKTALLAGYIRAIDTGLAALPSLEAEVYRGTAMPNDLFAEWERAYAEHRVVADPAFSSSSKSEEVAHDFLNKNRADDKVPVFCKIQSRTGKQVEFLSKTANEAEVLFRGGAKFRIEYIIDKIGPDGLPFKEVMLREVVDQNGGASAAGHETPAPHAVHDAAPAPAPVTAPRPATAATPTASTTSIEQFVIGSIPSSGKARLAYLKDPANWSPERAALHDQLLAGALADARAFAEAVQGEPTIYAMRGNTAAGKSRAIQGNIAALEGPTAATADRKHRAVNPDNFKQDLIAHTEGGAMTTQQVHEESAALAARLEDKLAGMRTADGKAPASILIDKRLAFSDDVQELIETAKSTGRQLNVYDVDAAFEVSLAGVLERRPDGPDPLPPFHIVANGFTAVRSDRREIISMFRADPTLGTYELYGTTPNGGKQRVAQVVDGKLTVLNRSMFDDITVPPVEAPEVFGRRAITEDAIRQITAGLTAERAAKVRSALTPYLGYTWRAALDAHASTTNTSS